MTQHKQIQWIRDLYHDKDESYIAEAEYNFRELILFLYFSDLKPKKHASMVLTENSSEDNVDKQ